MKKEKYTIINYVKNHICETIMDFIMPLLFSFTLLYIANATKIETYLGGLVITIICFLIRLFFNFKQTIRKKI